jgi:hypothetical protein
LTDETTAAHARTRAACSEARGALTDAEAAIRSSLTSEARSAAENSQGLETMVQADISSRTVEFCEQGAAELREVLAASEQFVALGLREDQPTGTTPSRVERSYPRYLAATSPHARITERYFYPAGLEYS